MNILLILLPEGDKRDQQLYPMVQLRTDRQAGLTFRGHSLFMRENKIPGEGEAIFPPLLRPRAPEPRLHSCSILYTVAPSPKAAAPERHNPTVDAEGMLMWRPTEPSPHCSSSEIRPYKRGSK